MKLLSVLPIILFSLRNVHHSSKTGTPKVRNAAMILFSFWSNDVIVILRLGFFNKWACNSVIFDSMLHNLVSILCDESDTWGGKILRMSFSAFMFPRFCFPAT